MNPFKPRVSLKGTSVVKGLGSVSLLTSANVLRLVSLLAVTILLGRGSGPAALGQFSLTVALASIMQTISTAGLSNAAIHNLLRKGGNFSHELRVILAARLIAVPAIFGLGYFLIILVAPDQLPAPSVLLAFFIGYAIGAVDIGDLSHTAKGHFCHIAIARLAIIVIVFPPKFYFATTGDLNLTLILLAIETALWQVLLVPGAGLIQLRAMCYSEVWCLAARQIWTVRYLWAASIVSAVSQRIDLFIVAAMLTVSSVGQYSAASRPIEATTVLAGSLIAVLFNAIARNSSSPRLYAMSSRRASKLMLITGLTITLLAIILGPPLILLLYGSSFELAAQIFIVYSLTIPFIFQEQLLVRILVIEQEHALNFASNVVALFINIGLNVILIPIFGLMGAAATAALCHPVTLCLTYALTTRGRELLYLTYVSPFTNEKFSRATVNRLIRKR